MHEDLLMYEEHLIESDLSDDELNDSAEYSSSGQSPNETITKVTTNRVRVKSTNRKGKLQPTAEVLNRRYTNLLLANFRLNTSTYNCLLSCDICEFRAPIRYKMLNHMKRYHMLSSDEATRKPFCCDICGKRLSTKAHLKSHMRIHTGERPYVCKFESCNRRFLGTPERQMHMRRHLSEKPYQCDKCPAAFINKSTMNNHKRNMHSDIRPFECELCGKSFKLRSTYQHHLLTHSDIRPYRCDDCGKSFRLRKSFIVHRNIHTDIRPYSCSICMRSFHSSSARRSHEKSYHKLI